MARTTLIIKLGSTMPDLARRRGDFEDWITEGMGLTRADVSVVSPPQGEPLPVPETLAGIVVSGSHAMVTDRAPWSEATALWLREAVARRVPLLAICYGHQLLAHAHGGRVADNPRGREYGTVDAHLTSAAASDPLLGGLATPIRVQTSHTQSVLHLPDGASLLATSVLDPHLAFRIGECAWGVQFHPEFDADIVRTSITHAYTDLSAEGQDPEALLAGCADTPWGTQILRRFAGLAARSSSASG